MSRDSWQAVRAVFLAAIMITSVFAAGIAFSGSAAALIDSIGGVDAENVTTEGEESTQNITLVAVNRSDDDNDNIDISIQEGGGTNLNITDATLISDGGFGSENVTVTTNSGDINVEIEGDVLTTTDLIVQATLDTSSADPGTVTYNANTDDAGATGTFEVQSSSDSPVSTLTVDDGSKYETIQAAVDNASSGDTIEVTGGSYDSVTIDKPITLTVADGAASAQVINVSGSGGPAVAIEAVDVTVEGFEIVGDDSTTSGISILTSNGANADITIKDNVIRGMAAPGGGGPGNFSFGILSFGSGDEATLSGVNITGNTIENIGSQGETQGVAISLEELNGTNPGDGALVENNEINDIATRNQDRPGTGIAIQPDDGSSSGAGDAAARVVGNEFSNTQIRVTHPVGDDTVEVPDQTQTVVEDGQVVFTDSGNIVVDADDGEGNFSSIQNAVDAAAPGATIVVRPGTFNESVTIDTEGVTLEGPNAGIAGDSDQRGAEATITDANGRLVIEASNVTIDGFNFEFNEDAIQSKSGEDNLITNSRFELTGDTSDQYAIRVGGGSPGTDVTNNLFTDIVSSDGTEGDNVNGIVVTDPRDTRVANNNFSNIDTAVNIGDKSPEAGTLIVENNEFSDITQFGAVALVNSDTGLDADINSNTIESSRIGIGVFVGSSDATFSIQNNDFQNFADDDVFVDDRADVLTLSDVETNNTFDRVVTIEDDAGNITGDSIFSAIQPAINNAEPGQVVEADPGTYDESVDISTKNVTLLGPNGGTPGDASRGDEAIIEQGLKINASEVTVDGLQIENNGTNGVRIGPEIVPDDVIIQHNRITNVEGGSFLRDGADTGAGNGIQIQFGVPEPNGETAQNIRIVDNEISDISTRDVGEIEGESGGTLAIGINVLPRGNDIRGLQIENNTIRSIEPGVPGEGDETETRAISVDTQLDDPGRDNASLNAAGQVSELRVTNNTFTDLTAGDGVAAITLFEDGRVSPRTGVENFEIRNNEFSRFDANDEVAVFIGGYEDLGRHDISLNKFSDGNIIRFDGDQSGYDVSEADTLDARLNFYNGRLSNDSITITGIGENSRGSDAVLYDPVLTVEPSERADNVENIRNYGSYIEVESDGEPTVIGFPAPPAEPLGELIPNETLQLGGDGEGAQIFLYDNAEQSFKEVNGDFVPEAGDVIVITTGGDPISGELIVPVDTELENVAGAPSQVQINEGWNLVATGAADQLRDPTATSEILAAAQFQTQPAQPGGPGATVSAYDGTWLFVADDGQLATGYVENQPPFGYSELVVLPNTEADDNDS